MGEILIGGTAALLICVFLSPTFIAAQRRRQFGQHIREEGPAGHHVKAGTPTMGGVIIFAAISIPFLILSDYDWRSIGVFGVAVLSALLGFLDDAQKIFQRRSLGIKGRWKLIVTIGISLLLWYVATVQADLPPTLRLRSLRPSAAKGRGEAPVGVEPTMADLQSAALATWLRRRVQLAT